MNTATLYKFGVLLTVCAALTFYSCKKESETVNSTNTDTEETDYAEDMARLDQVFDEVDNFALEAEATGNVGMKGGFPLSGCALVTVDTTVTPHKIAIDFGNANCLCKDGRYRRGKVIITYMGKYRISGYTHTIRFDGYYVNDNLVLGEKIVKNMGINSNGNTYFDITVNGEIILNKTGDTVSHTAARTRTWINGESTLQINDDAYNITGTSTHVKAKGKIFTEQITTPLLVALNCNWIKEGVIQITPQGGTARTLDYGNGICDDKATLTVNGKTKTIQLQ